MFSGFVESLKSFTPKAFILGAFFPLLAFVLINGVLLQLVFAPFKVWADGQVSAGGATFSALVVLLSLGVLAYVLWALNAFLRELLEGHSQSWWGETRLAEFLKARQVDMHSRWRTEYEEARAACAALQVDAWTTRLADAATKGQEAHPGKNTFDGTGPAADALRDLRKTCARGGRPSPANIEAVVVAFEAELQKHDITAASPSIGEGTLSLSDSRKKMLLIFDYASDEWAGQEIAVARLLQSRAGDTTAVAPTVLGNVAAGMQSYAIGRYRMDLDTMWSRLQPLLQTRKEFYAGLEDAKLRLDFLVACTWLCAATSVVWIVALPFASGPWLAFLAVALLGPIATRLCYWSAVQSYLAFADLVRTAIDLYRFDLLKALHVNLPTRLGHERRIWQALSMTISYGSEWMDIGYGHDASPGPVGADKK